MLMNVDTILEYIPAALLSSGVYWILVEEAVLSESAVRHLWTQKIQTIRVPVIHLRKNILLREQK